MMGDDGRSPEQVRHHLSPNANKDRRSRGGPRKLTLKRTENGFGFTLRHFVVYPPDTYSLLSGDRRYGLRGAPVDRPMDTIFVKSVRPGSGAALAGLSSGDQLVSVNGEPIAGRSYAQVVHLIQASPNYLHLLVVPQEEDLLQLYYGETAHNPLSNQRPSRVTRGSPQRSPASSSPARRIDNSLHYLGKMPGEPEYSGSSESVPGMPGGGYSLPPNLAGCRLSLDGGSSRRDSQDTTHSSDDSIIMSRFRKSLEQKEEFLKGVSSSSPSPLREFYSRPQKLSPPVWPPAIPASAVSQPVPKEAYSALKEPSYPTDNLQPLPPRGFVCGGLVTNAPMPDNSLRYSSARLGRIQEGVGGGGGRHTSPGARVPSPTRGMALLRDSSPPPGVGARHGSPPVRGASPLTVQPLRYVSEKARQFESGLIHPDKIDLYRSEIARLANKRNVPSVVVRRKEFENRAADWRQNRESRSLDSTSGSLSPTPTGNRTIPIGSTKVHCDPPKGYHDVMAGEVHKRIARPRSNSVEGVWNEKKTIRSSSTDPPLRHRAVRQDSYLAAVRAHASKGEQKKKEREGWKSLDETPVIRVLEASPVKRPQRPTRLELPLTNSPSPGTGGTPNSTPDSETRLGDLQSPLDLVVKRAKPQHSDDQGSEDDRATRRVSYLKATRIAMDSDLELSDNEPSWSPHGSGIVAVPVKDEEAVLEGQLFCKATQTDGKKAHGRSWRAVWAVLRGSVLFLFKDKKDATAETPVDHERLELNNSSVSAAEDYTKRRHVFRLSTPSSSEILLQADSADEMQRWLSALDSVSQAANNGGGQMSALNVSPVTAHKQGIMKNITTTLRNRSPTGVSPVTKNRKASQGELLVAAPAKQHKTWRQNVSRMAKTLKKIQSGAGSPVSPTAPTSYPEGATIGVPLEQCPKSIVNPYVPYIVELCTRIVEDKGLDVIGIYRVPGNTAAITSLTDAVNKGFKEAFLDQDQRWSDVNVISSLLKLFFRKLPDCLLTTELYPSFIKANKMEDPYQRITSIRNLVHELPDYNHQTLRHLMMHLKLVVEHSDINKMEARNLAIVFGPNLVRANDDNMVTMVTDMSHQCRIVETLIQHADWCFSDEALESLSLQDSMDNSGQVQEAESAIPNQSLLLGNVHKLEGMRGVNEVSRRDIVTSIITAANKKIKGGRARKGHVCHSAGEEIYDRGDKRKDNGSGRKGSAGDADTTDAKSIAGVVRDTVRVFSEPIIVPTLLDTDKVEENKEIEPPKQVTANDGTIITYQGLSETTQARIKRFELETKAMLQRDKVVNNKDWLKPSAPPAIGSKIAERGQTGSNESLPSPLAKWKHLTSPPLSQLSSSSVDSSSEALSRLEGSPLPSLARSHLESRLTRGSSFDSLTDSSSDVGTTNHHHRFSANTNSSTTTTTTTENATSNDLVSTLTLTFDAKLKSLGLTSPTDEKVEEKAEKDETSFRDPSLHRSFTSPNLEFKLMEFPAEANKEKSGQKVEMEKDDEKENCAISGGKLKRSESFKQREEKKENKLLRRSESLNKKEGSASKLKRSDSLTKTEKTDLNLTKRRQALEAATKKMKRKTGGGGERSIKRRHTVGGTKDFDKAAWLDNKEREASEERRTSSPDLSTDTSRPVLVLRPHSLVDSPLESHI